MIVSVHAYNSSPSSSRWPAISGPLKKAIRVLASQFVRRIFSFWPQFLHMLTIGQHYLSTSGGVETPFLSQPSVEPTGADIFDKPGIVYRRGGMDVLK